MKILCLFQKFSFHSSTIYLDLVHALKEGGHEVTVLAGTTEDKDEKQIYNEAGIQVVYVKLPDQFHAGKIKKGLVQLFMEPKMRKQLKRHVWQQSFDLILYPTPPITLAGVVATCRRHYQAKSYLMLKDIFPQNAVDLQMMGENSLIHRYFKRMEKRLYENSDYIGCMSNANIAYMKRKLPEALQGRLELFPNTVKVVERQRAADTKQHETVRFVFGGNLGKPQNIDFLLKGIERLCDYKKAEFLIIGDGTESARVEKYFAGHTVNAVYKKELPRREYEEILNQQDVGIVLLSAAFTIPNYPSRVLSYMQMAKPVLAVTDRVSDMKELVTSEAECGYWCPSDDLDSFVEKIHEICDNREKLLQLGENGRAYLERNFRVERSVSILNSHFE